MAGSMRAAAVVAATLLVVPVAGAGNISSSTTVGDTEVTFTVGENSARAHVRDGDRELTVSTGPIVPPCDLQELAADVYGADVTVEPVENPWWNQQFARYELYRATETTRFPTVDHAFAADRNACQGFDVTRDFPAIQRRDGVGLQSVTEEQAKTLAFAYATAVNPELLPDRQVVTSEDSSWLGRSVDNPEASKTLSGWDVTLRTWSPRAGILAFWSVELGHGGVYDGLTLVQDLDVGPSIPTWNGVNLRQETYLVHEYDRDRTPRYDYEFDAARWTGDGFVELRPPNRTRALDYEPVADATAFDGTQVQVTHPNATTAPAPLADSFASGLAAAYNDTVHRSEAACAGATNPGTDWGFTATDPDCTLEVRLVDDRSLLCTACVIGDDHARFYVAEDLALHLAEQDLYQDTDISQALAESLLGHLYLHRVQDQVTGWDPVLEPLLEGQALAAQSLLAPEVEAEPSSSFVGIAGNGPTGFQATPDAGICATPGASGLFLGHVAADRGVDTVLDTLQALAGSAGPCDERAAHALGEALGSPGAPMQAISEARLDFAQADLLGDLQWGTPSGDDVQNWSSHLDPLDTWDGFDGADSYDGSFGVAPVDVTGASTAKTSCWPGDDPYEIRLVEADAGTTTTTAVECGENPTVDASADQAAILGVRNGTSSGSLEVQAS